MNAVTYRYSAAENPTRLNQQEADCRSYANEHGLTITEVFTDTGHSRHGLHRMLDRILATTGGQSVPNDPKCRKIRQHLQTPLSEASLEQRRRSAEFDRVEMNDGGNVHRLILALVNG